MKLTNQFGLPEPFFRAVLNDKYSRGNAHYSVTDLIRPPRITILSRRHWEEIEEDVSERIWALLGRAVHAILEAAEPDNALTEERLFAEVAGRTISGASDLFHDGVVSDYKVTSIWTRIFGSRLEDWTLQLNFYAFLFRQIGFPVQALKIICIYRDWTPPKMIVAPKCLWKSFKFRFGVSKSRSGKFKNAWSCLKRSRQCLTINYFPAHPKRCGKSQPPMRS